VKPHRWFIAVVSRLVPRALRDEWRQEWDAELAHRETTVEQWRAPTFGDRARLLRQSSGAVWDALWLYSSRWQSVRSLLRHWRICAVAAVSLGVAVAATIVSFGLYDALLLRPPGVQAPRELVTIFVSSPSNSYDVLSYLDLPFYRQRARSFSGLAAFSEGLTSFAVTDVHDHLVGMTVSENYFAVVGVRPKFGTLTFPTGPGAPTQVVVVSEALWKRLGADPNLIGRTIRVDHATLTVLGVAPASFTGMNLVWRTDLWVGPDANLQAIPPTPPDRTDRAFYLLGRLAPDVTSEQAQAEVGGLSAILAAEYPTTDKDRKAFVTPTTTITANFRGDVMPALAALVGLALVTLVAACSNATNLLLGLALTRRHEMLVRTALGASRLQLMMPLLRESLTLAVAAGALGFTLAYGGLSALSAIGLSFGPDIPPPAFDVRPDIVVVAVAVMLAVVVGLGIGLGPAWRAAADGLSGALTRELASTGGRGRRLRSILLIVQTAVATTVLVGAVVAWRGVENLQRVDLGFSARDLVVDDLTLERAGYTRAAGREFYDNLRAAVARVPGVQAVSLASGSPLSGCCDRTNLHGDGEAASNRLTNLAFATVDDDYFATLGVRVIQGRTFEPRDTPRSQEVVVVNQHLARSRWPDQDPVGQHLIIENGNRRVEVIGVVADGKYESLAEAPQPMLYYSLRQHYQEGIAVIARTAGESPAFTRAIGQAITNLNRDLEIWVARTLKDNLRLELLFPTMIFMGLGGLGGLALLLTAIGLYGTVFYSVSQRRTEIGIRVALGAQPRDVLGLVLRQTLIFGVIGSAIGAGLSLLALPIVSSLFFGVHPAEPVMVSAVALSSVAISSGVGYVAARPWARTSAIEIMRAS
jgi:predicted permease